MSLKRALFEGFVRGYGMLAPSLAEPPANPRKIFVLRNNDIGDLLIVTPLFDCLKRLYPDAEILVGTGDWNRPVLEGNPNVDRIVPINAPWHNQQVRPQGLGPALNYLRQSKEIANLAAEKCDIGIDVVGSGYGSLLLLRAGIPFRMGVRGYAGGHTAAQLVIRYDAGRHVGEQALDFARFLGATDIPENRPQIFLDRTDAVNPNRIVIAPGGGFEAKRWPREHFAKLAADLGDREIILVGGPGDGEVAEMIASKNKNARSVAGLAGLRQTFRMISGAGLVICNSSMAMHAAAAFRRPCLVLLGTHFTSAREHAHQWAYPETVVIGPEKPDGQMATVDEALAKVRQMTFSR